MQSASVTSRRLVIDPSATPSGPTERRASSGGSIRSCQRAVSDLVDQMGMGTPSSASNAGENVYERDWEPSPTEPCSMPPSAGPGKPCHEKSSSPPGDEA